MNCPEQSTLMVKVRTNVWVSLPIDKGQDRLTKGWVCGVAEKAVIGLVLTPGLTPRKCGRERRHLVGNKDKFSYGKSNAPLQSVLNCGCHSLFREGNYERGRKGTP